jgi:hypothetical protein
MLAENWGAKREGKDKKQEYARFFNHGKEA